PDTTPTYDGSAYYTQVSPPSTLTTDYQGKSVDDWVKDQKSTDAKTRGESTAALGRFAAAAEKVVPILIARLTDKDAAVRVEATVSLGLIGKPAIPALREALKSEDPMMRMGAALSLGHMGSAGLPALDDLKGLLKDPDLAVRCHAAQALWRID